MGGDPTGVNLSSPAKLLYGKGGVGLKRSRVEFWARVKGHSGSAVIGTTRMIRTGGDAGGLADVFSRHLQ